MSDRKTEIAERLHRAAKELQEVARLLADEGTPKEQCASLSRALLCELTDEELWAWYEQRTSKPER